MTHTPTLPNGFSRAPKLAALTATETRMFELLADGMEHTGEECLLAGTGRRFSSEALHRAHLCNMRRKLAPLGFRIVSKRGVSAFRLELPTLAMLSSRNWRRGNDADAR